MRTLRRDLAAAHRLTAMYKMDDLTWNHISGRLPGGGPGDYLITPGDRMYAEMRPEDLVPRSGNVTADVIHGAVYAARPDVGAVVHVHTRAVCAVASLAGGFECLTQDSAQFHKRVAYHEWEGVSHDFDEQNRIREAIGERTAALIMRNHGACTLGSDVAEAWVRAYYLEKCCQVQIDLLACQGRVIRPSIDVLERAARDYEGDYKPGQHEWPALISMLEARGEILPI